MLARLDETKGIFWTMADARTSSDGQGGPAGMDVLLEWIECYLMAEHPNLGRMGAVCPFTKQAARLDTVRVAISPASPTGRETARALVRSAFHVLNSIPCKKGMEHFRTVIIGFPSCQSDDGIARLKAIQRSHRLYSLSRGRMIGLMHPSSEDKGLWNNDFRPLRAPMPVIAVRHMVEHDAPFAALHPMLMLAYLARFPFKGTKRLAAHWQSRL